MDGNRILSLKVWAPNEPVVLKNVTFNRGKRSGWIARYNEKTGQYERHFFDGTIAPASLDDFYTKKAEVTMLGMTEQPNGRATPEEVLKSDGLKVRKIDGGPRWTKEQMARIFNCERLP